MSSVLHIKGDTLHIKGERVLVVEGKSPVYTLYILKRFFREKNGANPRAFSLYYAGEIGRESARNLRVCCSVL